MKTIETRKSPEAEYTLADLEALTGPELVSIYNLTSSCLETPEVRKFKDMTTAIARTWAQLKDYQEWLEEPVVLDDCTVKSRKDELENPTPKYKTREEWLEAAVVLLDKGFFKKHDHKLPENLKVGIGFAGGEKAIGVCFSSKVTEDETTHIFICPTLGKEVTRVLDVLLHEMIHASLNLTNPDHKHGPDFRKVATEFGLTGKMTATVVEEDSDLHVSLIKIAEELGVYPHSPITLKKIKKPTPVSKWVSFTSMNDNKYKVDANIDRVVEHGRPRDFKGDPMIATKDEVEMQLLEAGVTEIEE